ncbi:MAG: hypothetical protein WBS24_14370 [Terriglobales bacterium]
MTQRYGVVGRRAVAEAVGCALIVWFSSGAGLAQTGYSGAGVYSGLSARGLAASGPPVSYMARPDLCEVGTETGPLGCAHSSLCPSCSGPSTAQPMVFLGPSTMSALPIPGPASGSACGAQPANGQYLCGLNTTVSDPDFGTQSVRATSYGDSILNGSAAYNTLGFGFNIGSDGNLHRWASDSSKLLVNNSGGSYIVLAFNPGNWGSNPVTVSSMHGNAVLGSGVPAFALSHPHELFEFNTDQESTVLGAVTSGACATPETMTQGSTGAHATLLAINAGTLMQIGATTETADGTHTWLGGTSGCVFTPTEAPTGYTYANTIYAGLIDDATQSDPTQWTITYSLVTSFNYVAGLGAAASSTQYLFPQSATSCLPAGFNGAVMGSPDDDSTDTMLGANYGDNVQDGIWDSTHAGDIYRAQFWAGHGCRVANTHTDLVTGDWGATGQLVDGQHSYIAGTLTGTPSFGATLTQSGTGATTQYFCSAQIESVTQASGSTAQRLACGPSGATGWEAGLIYGTANGTGQWSDGSGHTLAPSAGPMNAPFYYPNPLHDSSQTPNVLNADVSPVQTAVATVASVQIGAPAGGEDTITLAGTTHYAPDMQVVFYGLTAGGDTHLNCTNPTGSGGSAVPDPDSCPVWTVVQGCAIYGGCTSFVIADAGAAGGATNTEGTANLRPYGVGYDGGYSFMNTPDDWIIASTTINPYLSLQLQGHGAEGQNGEAMGNNYTWAFYSNPSTPCAVSGPATPCPSADMYALLPNALPEDNHGTSDQHGPLDLSPFAMALANVCGQASGMGQSTCIQSYTKAWESEMIAVENSVTNNASFGCGATLGPGCHCNYGSGPAACTYRLGHSFNSNDNYVFQAQNAIGNISPDGNYMAYTSSWMNTLGCTNGATNCWGSYIASGPAAASMSGATIQTDASGVVTVTMANQFCAPGGNQYYWTGSAVTTIACGALAEQVTLSGFAESWANQTMTLTAVGGCDSTDANAGNCTSFSGTGTGIPANYGPVTESTGTQKGAPVNCGGGSGVNTYCQRADVWIAKLGTAQ